MIKAAITDYLDTQGLKLPVDEVHMACLTAQTVINMAAAEIEHSLLWYGAEDGITLADGLPENPDNHALLRQLYLALDSLYSRCANTDAAIDRAAIYLLLPANAPQHGGQLLRLVAQGQPLETLLPVDEAACWHHIASRSAETGWLNQVDDVAQWLALGELQGEQHRRSHSQLALPVYGQDGRVLGVVYAEAARPNAFDNDNLAQWVGLALALLPLLQQLHSQWQPPPQPSTEENHDQ